MTRKDVAEIFSYFMLAWPSAPVFKNGGASLKSSIDLWATCLDDIDFEQGKRIAIELCKTSIYPPSIAEFRNAAGLNAPGNFKPGPTELAAIRKFRAAMTNMKSQDARLIDDGSGNEKEKPKEPPTRREIRG